MPDPKKGAGPPRPPPKIAASSPPPRPPPAPAPLGGGTDLPLPSDRRSRALEPLKGAMAEKLGALQQLEISESTLIQGYRAGLFGLAALLLLQVLAPAAVP